MRDILDDVLVPGGRPRQDGGADTVCNTGVGPRFESNGGAEYRLVVENFSGAAAAIRMTSANTGRITR